MLGREVKEALFERFARLGKAVASPHRIELLDLFCPGERTVEALAEANRMGVTNTSAHLQVLRQARLVETRREGVRVYYRLADDEVCRFYFALSRPRPDAPGGGRAGGARLFEARGELDPIYREDLVHRIERGEAAVLDPSYERLHGPPSRGRLPRVAARRVARWSSGETDATEGAGDQAGGRRDRAVAGAEAHGRRDEPPYRNTRRGPHARPDLVRDRCSSGAPVGSGTDPADRARSVQAEDRGCRVRRLAHARRYGRADPRRPRPGRDRALPEGYPAVPRRASGTRLDTILATVLFSDLVGSTETQVSLGDRRWRDLLHRHHGLVRDSLASWHGVENDTASDGFYATFDGAGRAIRCALEIAE